MGRILNATGILVAVAAASAVYHVKYEASSASEQVAGLSQEIARERGTIAVLRAEWSHLTHPARLQSLADRYLELAPMEARQIVQASEVPERLPEPAIVDAPQAVPEFGQVGALVEQVLGGDGPLSPAQAPPPASTVPQAFAPTGDSFIEAFVESEIRATPIPQIYAEPRSISDLVGPVRNSIQ